MRSIIEIGTGSFIFIAISCLLIFPLGALYSYKVIVILIAKCFKTGLSALETGNVDLVERDGGENIGWVLQLDGNVSLDNVQKLFKDTFLKASGYTQLQCHIVTFLGYTFLEKVDNVNLNRHIYEINLEDTKESRLEEEISRFINGMYEEDKPCWELVLLQRKITGKSCLVFKIHRGLADNNFIVHILDCLTENKFPCILKKENESAWQQIKQTLSSIVHLKQVLLYAVTFSKKHAISPSSDPSPLLTSFGKLDLPTLERIGQRHNVQLNSVVISLVTSALSKHIQWIDESEVAVQLSLLRSYPVKLRGENNAGQNQLDKLCSKFSESFIRVPVHENYYSSVQKLVEVEERLRRYEEVGVDKFITNIIHPCMSLFPNKLISNMISKFSTTPLQFSSLDGRNNYHFLGNRVDRVHVIGSMADVPTNSQLMFGSFTHSGKYEIVLQSISHQVKEVDDLRHFVNKILPKQLEMLDEESQKSVEYKALREMRLKMGEFRLDLDDEIICDAI